VTIPFPIIGSNCGTVEFHHYSCTLRWCSSFLLNSGVELRQVKAKAGLGMVETSCDIHTVGRKWQVSLCQTRNPPSRLVMLLPKESALQPIYLDGSL
jgi:hypothetical protein